MKKRRLLSVLATFALVFTFSCVTQEVKPSSISGSSSTEKENSKPQQSNIDQEWADKAISIFKICRGLDGGCGEIERGVAPFDPTSGCICRIGLLWCGNSVAEHLKNIAPPKEGSKFYFVYHNLLNQHKNISWGQAFWQMQLGFPNPCSYSSKVKDILMGIGVNCVEDLCKEHDLPN